MCRGLGEERAGILWRPNTVSFLAKLGIIYSQGAARLIPSLPNLIERGLCTSSSDVEESSLAV